MTTCAACGAKASGRFCSNCGKALAAGTCLRCGAPLDPSARFCSNCGDKAGIGRTGTPGLPIRRVLATVAALAAAGALFWAIRSGSPQPGAPAAASATQAGPPDLSQLTPRERFDRLFNRVMTAAEAGDTAEVVRFLPMARMAYVQLPEVNADARYHMAMLEIQSDNANGALAQADSIASGAPRHLFIYLIREAVAARNADSAAARAARRDLMSAWDSEIALERSEYEEHREALERVRAGRR